MGKRFMNIMNIMKHFRGVWGVLEKKHVFFISIRALGLFSCSFCFITFIKSLCEMKMGVVVRQIEHTYNHFMNIMKVYEVGVLNENFCKAVSVWLGFMKFCNYSNFINLHKRGELCL